MPSNVPQEISPLSLWKTCGWQLQLFHARLRQSRDRKDKLNYAEGHFTL